MSEMQHRHARLPDLSLIDVLTLPVGMPKRERPQGLTCPGCGRPVRPRLGEKRVRHFYHSEEDRSFSCSGESYLHQSGKKALAEAVETLIREGRPLTLLHPTGVRHVTYTWDHHVLRERFQAAERRLDTAGAEVRVERGELGFVADVRMQNRELTLFLEVAVSHPCSPEKIASGLPILEFSITCEEDIERMVGEVRSGRVIVGDAESPVRTWNLGLQVTHAEVQKAGFEELLQSANLILERLCPTGQKVRLRDGSTMLVPRRHYRPGAWRKRTVVATTEEFLMDYFWDALDNGDPGLLAILPDDFDAAAELIRQHVSGKRAWVPELISVNPFDLMGRFSPAIPERVRDRIVEDGTLERWRERFGIRERVLTPPPAAPAGVSTPRQPHISKPERLVTVSRSRNGRLTATRDGRVFGALIASVSVDASKPDIWVLDRVMRRQTGFVRSCLLCRHHAFSHDERKPIFCFRSRTSCHQTEAVTCDGWSWIREESELATHRKRVAESPKAPPLAKMMTI